MRAQKQHRNFYNWYFCIKGHLLRQNAVVNAFYPWRKSLLWRFQNGRFEFRQILQKRLIDHILPLNQHINMVLVANPTFWSWRNPIQMFLIAKLYLLLSKSKMATIKTTQIIKFSALTPCSYRFWAQNNTLTFMSGIVVLRDIFWHRNQLLKHFILGQNRYYDVFKMAAFNSEKFSQTLNWS